MTKHIIYLSAILLLVIYIFTKSTAPTSGALPVLKPVVQKIDKNGNQYTTLQQIFYSKAQMQSIVDSVANVYKAGKIKTVIVTVSGKKDTQFVPKYVYIDTGTGIFNAADSNKDYAIGFKGNWKTNFAQFRLQITPDTASYFTAVKTHTFRPSVTTVIITHTNSLWQTAQGTSYSTTTPVLIAAVGPTTGITYNGSIQPFIGIGITLNLVGIKRKK